MSRKSKFADLEENCASSYARPGVIAGPEDDDFLHPHALRPVPYGAQRQVRYRHDGR